VEERGSAAERGLAADLGRRRAATEVAIAWLLAELAFWYVTGPFARPVRALAGIGICAVIALSMRRRGIGPAALLGSPARGAAWARALALTAVAGGIIVTAGWGLDLWRGLPTFDFARPGAPGAGRWWIGKLAAVSAQQLVLQGFAYPLFREILGRRGPALAASALLFGVLHLPNLPLAILSGAAAPVWCALYLRDRSLVPLIASHLALAIVARAACGDAIYNMRIGAGVLPLLPYTLEDEAGERLRVAPLSIEGFVDVCRPEGDRVVCDGWSADVDRGVPARAVVVWAAGGLHRFPLTGLPRPDVAEVWQRESLRPSGFRITLPGDWFEGEVRFFGLGEDRAAELGTLEGYDRDL